MAKPGITVTWTNDMGYGPRETTLATLNAHRPMPEIKTAMTFKGDITPDRVLRVIGMLESIEDLDITVKVSATWDKGRLNPSSLPYSPARQSRDAWPGNWPMLSAGRMNRQDKPETVATLTKARVAKMEAFVEEVAAAFAEGGRGTLSAWTALLSSRPSRRRRKG